MFAEDQLGLTYVPRYVRQVSDLEYGALVTHENYNEKLNLNTTQGDYNTEVLKLLLTESDPSKTFHIPYLDKAVSDELEGMHASIDEQNKVVSELYDNVSKYDDTLSGLSTGILNIINGTTVVKSASEANKISNIENAGMRKYYGTNNLGTPGFHEMPESIYTSDMLTDVDIDQIYYTPEDKSITESKLSDDVVAKLNKQSITAYPELTDLPKINNVELRGSLDLATLGIQPAGNYLTAIPNEYVTESELTNALGVYLKTATAATTYATKKEVTDLSTTVTNNANNAASKYTVCQIGSFSGTPKTGDLLVVI